MVITPIYVYWKWDINKCGGPNISLVTATDLQNRDILKTIIEPLVFIYLYIGINKFPGGWGGGCNIGGKPYMGYGNGNSW